MENLRVLMAEDNPGDALLARLDLEGHGENVDLTIANSCAEFVQRLREHEYDCAVLDFHLPDGDADALLQAIRLLAPELPTVVMSGCDDQDVVTQTLRNGGDDFVSKTHIVDSDELWQRVTRTVMRHRQQRMRRRMSGTPPAAPLARC